MAYLRNWRRYNTFVHALAQSSSSENDVENQLQAVGGQQTTPERYTSSVQSDSGEDQQQQHINEPADYDSDSSMSVVLTSDEDNENEPEECLPSQIAEWATKFKCTRSCINHILEIFRKQGHRVPKDARTLLQTPQSIDIIRKCGGNYYYVGLLLGLTKTVSLHPNHFEDENSIKLSFNIDGVPLFKSSSVQFWPILCSVNSFEPFIVALFCGTKKPDSVEEYLLDFVEELCNVENTGFQLNDKHFAVIIDSFICDAPARSFLKCTKGHNAYFGCDRCTIKGVWRGRVVFEQPDGMNMPEKRTKEDFNELQYTDYQLKRSPLVDIGIDCIKSFPLDYMHLVCLGVMKRILMFLKSGPRECKLSHLQIELLSDKLVALNGKMPREFARQPRSLEVLDRWKATEYRQCILYTGPLIFRNIMHDQMYQHFLALTVAMSILLDSRDASRNHYLNYAKELLEYFVKKAPQIYGETFTTYNIHSLVHISDDVKNYGVSLNELSAFRFENYLQKLKKFVKKAQNPIAQVAKRLFELERTTVKPWMNVSTTYLSTKRKDSCLLLKDQSFAFLQEKRENGELICKVVSQQRLENLFINPCESKLINVAVVKNTTLQRHGREKIIRKHDIDRKVACLPYDGKYVLFPLLHGIERQY